MPSLSDLKTRAISVKKSTTERAVNFKDRHSSVSTKQLDLEDRQARNAARPDSERPSSYRRAKPPPPPPPHRQSSVVPASPSPGPPPAPVRRQGPPLEPSKPVEDEKIDWVNLSDSDKETFFSLLDVFFAAFMRTGRGPQAKGTKSPPHPAPSPAPPPRPPLPARKSTTEVQPDAQTSHRPSIAGPKAEVALPPRTQARSVPPLPSARGPPPIASSARPPPPTIPARPSGAAPPSTSVPAPASSAFASPTTCLCCRDFTAPDTHAAQFPRHTITSLPALAASLTAPFPSHTDRARAIFTWLHHNIAYDAENFLAGTVSAQTPEQTLRMGKAVCEGYAGLFAVLAVHAGLECVVVTGHGKGFGYAPPAGGGLPRYAGNHAWNAVKLDEPDEGGSPWKLVDSCWGAGALEGGGVFKKRFAPTHFTESNAAFGRRHFPDPPPNPRAASQQYVPASETLTWEQYLLLSEQPRLMSTFEEYGYSSELINPPTRLIPPGSHQFYLKGFCAHFMEDQADWQTPLLIFPARDQSSMTPLELLPEGGWLAEMAVGSGEKVQLGMVRSVGGSEEAAAGLGAAGFRAILGRKAMSFAILAEWEVE